LISQNSNKTSWLGIFLTGTFFVVTVFSFLAWIETDKPFYFISLILFLVVGVISLWVRFSHIAQLTKRTTVLILAFLSVLLVVPGAIVLDVDLDRTIKDLEIVEYLQYNREIAEKISDFFEENQHRFSLLLEKVNETKAFDPQSLKPLFSSFVEKTVDVSNLCIADSAGMVVFGFPLDFKSRVNFNFSLKENEVRFFELNRSIPFGYEGESQIMSLKMISRLTNQNHLNSYLFAVVDLSRVRQFLTSLPKNIDFYIFDEDKSLVYASTLKKFPTVLSSSGYSYDDKLVSIQTSIRPLDWSMIAVYDAELVFGEANKIRQGFFDKILLFIVFGTLAALVLIFYLTRSILSPITTLSNNAAAISSGEFERSITENFKAFPKDEIGDLTVAIDQMVKELRIRMDAQATLNQKLISVQEKLDQQLSAAHRIQIGMLPSSTLYLYGVEVAGTLRLIEEVGGDHLDFFRIDDRNIGIVLLDAAGKGVSASFYAALTRGFIDPGLRGEQTDLSEWIESIDEQFQQLRDSKTRTIAMVYAVLDTITLNLSIVNAGFEQPKLVRAETVEPIEIKGRALGMPAWLGSFETQQLKLAPVDLVFFHSDGLEDPVHCITVLNKLGEADLMKAIKDEVEGLSDIYDDISACCLRINNRQIKDYEFASVPGCEEPLISEIKKSVGETVANKEHLNDIGLAMREIIVNAVKHGNIRQNAPRLKLQFDHR